MYFSLILPLVYNSKHLAVRFNQFAEYCLEKSLLQIDQQMISSLGSCGHSCSVIKMCVALAVDM